MIDEKYAERAVTEATAGKSVGIVARDANDGRETASQLAGIAHGRQLAYSTTRSGEMVSRIRFPAGGEVTILAPFSRNLRGRRFDVVMALEPTTDIGRSGIAYMAFGGQVVWL